jgi:hypothetical protein
MRVLSFIFIMIILSSCSGGGGGVAAINPNFGSFIEENLNNSRDYERRILPNFCKDECKAVDFETAEYKGIGQNFLSAINAAEAYAFLANQEKKWAGDDVRVAVVDTGVSLHDDLQENILTDQAATGSLDDYNGHGTHVAGIIAASKDDKVMHGVAPQAKIIAVKWAGLRGVMPGIYDFDNHVINTNASVVNGSFGSYGYNKNVYDMVKHLVNDGAPNLVQVYAAGNDSNNNPLYPAIFADNEEMKGQLLAVEAFDINNDNIAYFSNRCGRIKRCLAAPGVTIYSTIPGNQYQAYSGTSMAAPVVSGAVAILQAAWPNLNGKDIVDLLLLTTTPKKNNVNLLNLEGAVNPVGEKQTIIAKTFSYISYDSTKLVIPNLLQESFKEDKFKEFLAEAVFFDSFKRDYKANYQDKIIFYDIKNKLENSIIKRNEKQNINMSFTNMKVSFSSTQNKLDNYIFLTPMAKDSEVALENILLSKEFNKLSLSFNRAKSNIEDDVSSSFIKGFNLLSNENYNDYFAKISADIDKFSADYKFNVNSSLKFNIVKANSLHDMGNIKLINSAYSRKFNNIFISFAHELVKEENAVMGIAAMDGFAALDNSLSNKLAFTMQFMWGKNKFLMKYAKLAAKNNNKDNSLIELSDHIKADNFIFTYVRNLPKLALGFSFSSPMQIKNGTMKFTLPTGYDAEGNIKFADYNMDLASYEKYDYEVFLLKRYKNAELNLNFNLEEQKFADDNKYSYEASIAFSKFF